MPPIWNGVRARTGRRLSIKRFPPRRCWDNKARVDQALLVLNAFRSRYGEEPRIEQARQELERAQQEFQRAATTLAERATALLAQDPAGVTALLSGAPAHLREHPEVLAVADAAAKAEQEQQARRQAAELTAKARELSARAEFAEALRVLDEGFARFPAQPEISRARAEVTAALDQQRREKLRHSTVAQVREHLEHHRYGEAERAIAGALEGNPDSELQRLRGEVEAHQNRWIAECAEQEIRDTLARTAELLAQNPAEAVALLETLARKFPNRAEISASLAEARDAVARQERRELIQSVERLCERQEFDAALAKLTVVRPDASGEIASALDRVKSLREEADRRRAAAAIQSARELRDRDPQGALRQLESLAQPLRSRPEIEPEIRACRQAIADAERSAALAVIAELCASGKFAKARKRHKEAIARFGSGCGARRNPARNRTSRTSERAPRHRGNSTQWKAGLGGREPGRGSHLRCGTVALPTGLQYSNPSLNHQASRR